MPTRFDVIKLEKAQVTPEGWVKDTPVVTRAGIFEYRRADGTVRREFRPPEEVFDPESLSSMLGVPVTDAHNDLFHVDNTKGIIGSSIGPGLRQDANDPKNHNVILPLVIHNPKGMGANRELSLGYTLGRCDETPGEWEGQKYDAVQRGIRINHIAVVPRGRAGVSRLRLDAADAVSGLSEEDLMADPVVKLVSVRMDSGLEYQAAPEVAMALTSAQNALSAAMKRADTAEAERDTLKTKVTEAEGKLVQARADGVVQARQRLVLEGTAKTLKIDVKDTDTDRAIREAVVKKVRGDSVDFTGKSDDYVMAMFDSASAEAAPKPGNAAAQQREAQGSPSATRSDAAPQAGAPGTGGARGARARFLSNPGAAYRA